MHIDPERQSVVKHEIEELVVGSAGEPPAGCQSERVDFCDGTAAGFVLLTVSDRDFGIDFYGNGNSTPVKQLQFRKP